MQNIIISKCKRVTGGVKRFLLTSLLVALFLVQGCTGSEYEMVLPDEKSTDNDRNEQVVADLVENEETTEVEQETDRGIEKKDDLIMVYVCGCVVNPGVYEAQKGSRIIDFVNMAGGFTPLAAQEYVNLASFAEDADRIYIPSMDEIEANVDKTTDQTDRFVQREEEQGAKVNINIASESEMTQIVGIGPGKAKNIVEYRTKNGKFKTIEDIMNVSGIGEGTFEKIKEQITV